MPKKKKNTGELEATSDVQQEPAQKIPAEHLWTYQLTIIRTKPRAQLPGGKLGPSRVEKVYSAVSHGTTDAISVLTDALVIENGGPISVDFRPYNFWGSVSSPLPAETPQDQS